MLNWPWSKKTLRFPNGIPRVAVNQEAATSGRSRGPRASDQSRRPDPPKGYTLSDIEAMWWGRYDDAILSMAEYDQQVNPDTPRWSAPEYFNDLLSWKTTTYPSPYANDPEMMEALSKMEPPPESFTKLPVSPLSKLHGIIKVSQGVLDDYMLQEPWMVTLKRAPLRRAQRLAEETYWTEDESFDNPCIVRGED